MIFGKSKLELKVGIFVFVGLVILALFVMFIGDFKTWTEGYHMTVRFNFVDGVKVGAPVRFEGVYAGEVNDVKLTRIPSEEATKVDVVCWVHKEVRIPIDSTVWVNTLGLLGEKYIEIMPGKNYSAFVAKGQIVVGTDPLAMHEVSQSALKLIDKIDKSIDKVMNGEGTLPKLMYDDSLYNDMKSLLSDAKKGVDSLVTNMESLVDDIKSNPWKLLSKPKPARK